MDKTKAVGFQVRELSNMIRRSMDEQIAQLHIDEITSVQAWIMGYIAGHGEKEIFQRDIEREFHIRRSSVAETLRLMEKKGLILRECVAHDARLKKLILTSKGREIHEQITDKIMELEEGLTVGLSDGELMIFLEIIEKIKKNVK